MTIALRTDYDAVRIRAAARAAPDSVQACRLLSIAAICEGKSRAEAAALGGMSRQTLRDWVRRFNAEGPDGLVNRKAPGARRRLSAAQLAELSELVGTGPDPQTDGVVRWRRVDLRAEIERRFGVEYHERSASRLLHELGFSHMSARPLHPKQDAEVVDAYKKSLPPSRERAGCRTARGNRVRDMAAG